LNWRGFLYTGILTVTTLIGLWMIIGALAVPSDKLILHIEEINKYINDGQWDQAQDTYDSLRNLWQKENLYLGVNSGEGDRKDFDQGLARLKVALREKEYLVAVYELEVMKVLVEKMR
jgi:hypothetical protein